jgi:hypothetical protein
MASSQTSEIDHLYFAGESAMTVTEIIVYGPPKPVKYSIFA